MRNEPGLLPRLVSGLLVAALIAVPPFAWAIDDAPTNANENAYEFEGSIMSEAVRATIGRVFGVGGEAANIEYHAVELSEHKPANAALRSALIPGWGQAFNGEKVKGSIYFLSFAVAATGAVLSYRKSSDSYDKYVTKGAPNDALYDDYSRQRSQAYILGGAAAFCWVLSILDARRNAYQPIYSQDSRIQIAWNGEQGNVRWRKKF